MASMLKTSLLKNISWVISRVFFGGFLLFSFTCIPVFANQNTLYLNFAGEPDTLNPMLTHGAPRELNQLFEGIMSVDENGKIVPGVAQNYKISPDGRKYTFKIRKSAKWSNGEPITADDFEYTWKKQLSPDSASSYAYQLFLIKNAREAKEGKVSIDKVAVHAINSHTLEVELVEPAPYFLELVAYFSNFPVNKKIDSKNPSWAKKAGKSFVSNGPFRLVEWRRGRGIVMEKNPYYWDAKNVKIPVIKASYINDSNTEFRMFEQGEIQWSGRPFGFLPVDAIPYLIKQGRIHTKSVPRMRWVNINIKKFPFNNLNIRKAFALSINRKALTERVLQGGESPATYIVPTIMFPSNKKGYFKDNDVAQAKKYLDMGLKELKLNSVKDLPSITYSYYSSAVTSKTAQALQDMWRKNLGIEVKLNSMENNVFTDFLLQGNFDLALDGWMADFNDAINFLTIFEDKMSVYNFARWNNRKYKNLLIAARKEVNKSKRLKMLKMAERILINDFPLIPLFNVPNAWVQDPKLKGVVMGPTGFPYIKYAHFK